jgi:cysteinyl-tRNA synthetase
MESALNGGSRPGAEDIRTVLLWRAQERRRGNWNASDEIRNWLKEAGVLVEDTRDGFYWKYQAS